MEHVGTGNPGEVPQHETLQTSMESSSQSIQRGEIKATPAASICNGAHANSDKEDSCRTGAVDGSECQRQSCREEDNATSLSAEPLPADLAGDADVAAAPQAADPIPVSTHSLCNPPEMTDVENSNTLANEPISADECTREGVSFEGKQQPCSTCEASGLPAQSEGSLSTRPGCSTQAGNTSGDNGSTPSSTACSNQEACVQSTTAAPQVCELPSAGTMDSKPCLSLNESVCEATLKNADNEKPDCAAEAVAQARGGVLKLASAM